MSFLKRLFENPIDRKRRELFTAAAANLQVAPVADTEKCGDGLQQYQSLRSNKLKSQRAFSCWQSAGTPVFRLVDLGVVSARGGWQWTVVLFADRFPSAPEFLLSGKDILHAVGEKVGRSAGIALPGPTEFAAQYVVQGSDTGAITALFTPGRIQALLTLPLPRTSTIEMRGGRLVYQQSLNHRSSNAADFNPRQAQPADIEQIVREGTAVFNIFNH